MAVLADGSIDLTVTSPPYDNARAYNGYTFPFPDIAAQLWRVTADGGVVVWIVNDMTVGGSETGSSFRQALVFMDLGFRLHDTMIYHKNGCRFPESNRYYPCWEYMFVLSKGKPKTVNLIADRPNKAAGTHRVSTMEPQPDGRVRRPQRHYVERDYGVRYNVWTYTAGHGHTAPDTLWEGHPAVMPLALARDHVLSWSAVGDTVLDPMSGSGQVLIAAKELGRKYIGFDMSADYVTLARQRLELYKGAF